MRLTLAGALGAAGDYRRAVEQYDLAIESAPRDESARFGKAMSLLLAGLELGARPHLEASVDFASYELAKLLDLDLVPPTVPRRICGKRGSLQLWIKNARTFADWYQDPDRPATVPPEWSRSMANTHLLRQLSYDADFMNASNVIVEAAERLWAIDFSRAFRIQRKLLAEEDLERFSRSVLERLRALDEPTLKERLGEWLSKSQRLTMLARSDLILALAERRVAELGEGPVLFH